jgi:hypothetical protein
VKHNILSLPHPPYSPDHAVFLQLNKTIKGNGFYYVEEFQANVVRKLRAIAKVTTSGAFVSGRNTGISAYKYMDTT